MWESIKRSLLGKKTLPAFLFLTIFGLLFSIVSVQASESPTIVLPASFINLNNSTNFSFSGVAEDVDSVLSFLIDDSNDATSPVAGTTTIDVSGNYSVGGLDLSSLDDGVISIAASSTESTDSLTTITKDTVIPVISFISPTPANGIYGSSTSATISVDAGEALSGATLQIGLANGGLESGNLDYWTTTGTAPWIVDTQANFITGSPSEGTYLARSGSLNGQVGVDSILERDITVAVTSTLSFKWMDSSLCGLDDSSDLDDNGVIFYLDGTKIDKLCGSHQFWQTESVTLAPGSHNLMWRYYRSDASNSGWERAWLDDIVIDNNYSVSLTAMSISASQATVNYSGFSSGDNEYRVVATDLAGNVAKSSDRHFLVDALAPVISLVGSSTIDMYQTDSYQEAGATAVDGRDGDLTSQINITNPVTTSTAGTYTIVYRVADTLGNVGVATRTVNVIDNIAPIVSGVVSGTTYNHSVAPTFNEGLALLNSQPFVSGSAISGNGSYALVVADPAHNTTTISFVISVSSGGGGGGGGGSTFTPVTSSTDSTPSVPAETVDVPPVPQILGVKIYGDGTLIKSPQGRIYILVNNGHKRYISTLVELQKYKKQKIYNVSETDLAQYPDYVPGGQVLSVKIYANGSLIKSSSSKVYLVTYGMKQLLTAKQLKSSTYKKKKINSLADEELALYPDYMGNNSLIKGSTSKIYTISNGNRKTISSTKELKNKKYRGQKVKTISDDQLNLYPLI